MTFKCLAFNELSLHQLYDIIRLRQEVFVVEQNCAYLDADGNDEVSFHLMGYNEEMEIIAYARILPKGLTYPDYASIGRVVTSSKARGGGFGKLLMREALQQAKVLFGKDEIKISAQYYLIQFYEDLNFKVVGEKYLEDDILHISMITN